MAQENLRTALAPSDRCMALSDRSFVSAGSFTSFVSAVSVTGTEGSPTVSEASLHTAVRSESITEQDPLVDTQALLVQAPVRVHVDPT
ncbi:hypothetical protein AAVH_10488 [Aphelenchoides avenae]|nr:hypothetical protein AAVH_10488 [Aphelenchus avenae]